MSKSLNLELLNRKSASALNSPDKHKTHRTRRLHFALLSDVAYDLEGLGAGAGQLSKSKKVILSYFIGKEDVS
jgi:hypothetical protein